MKNNLDHQPPITWRDIKDFLNQMPEGMLEQNARVLVDDETYSKNIVGAEFLEEDIYANKDDDEDAGTLEDLKLAHGDDFQEKDYKLSTSKGTPFLYAE